MRVILIAESHGSGLQIQSLDSAVGDGNAVRVAAEVGQDRLWAGKGPLGVDNPARAADSAQPTGKFDRV